MQKKFSHPQTGVTTTSLRGAESDVATDAAEREQRVLAHFAEPRGGKATNVD